MFFCLLQNAEMRFNFGDKPFKYPCPQGYVALSQAPKEKQTKSSFSIVSAPAKAAPNAPQAIVIEVNIYPDFLRLFILL